MCKYIFFILKIKIKIIFMFVEWICVGEFSNGEVVWDLFNEENVKRG